MPPAPSPNAFFTPLRYPGGKGKLAPFIKRVFEENRLVDGYYAEPYAGGSAVALELLLHGYVTDIYINDISPSVGAFWRSVLNHTDELCRLIKDTKVTMKEWHRQRAIQNQHEGIDDVTLGFSTFFLNRTNRSGILSAGVIGGKNQDGPWKIDARYNVTELTRRIQVIANQRRRIYFSQLDAIEFIKDVASKLPSKSLIYLDPPYYVKGKDLYLHYYEAKDHARIAKTVSARLKKQHWIVSYDDVPEIAELYNQYRGISYTLSYSAQTRYKGGEAMFFSDNLDVPDLIAPMRMAA